MTLSDDELPMIGGQQPPEQMNEHPASSQEEEKINSRSAADEGRLSFPPLKEAAPDFDFPRMDNDVAAFRRQLDARQVPAVEAETLQATSLPVRRRRRPGLIAQRINASELGERLGSITQRVSPTVDFFVFSFLCGCVLGVGYILDAPAILLIGILVAPLLGPWIGAALSTATGETRLFRQTFGGMLIGLAMVFIVGLLAGLASRIFQPLTSSQAFYHARLWWPDLLMMVIGTAVLVIAFIQSDDKPVIPSLMVAYEFYLPVSAAGFGLGSGVEGLWPEAGLVFLIHMALSLIIGLIIFFYMGFRPEKASGYALTVGLVLAGLLIVAGFAGLGSLINIRGDQDYAMLAVTHTSTPVETLPATASPKPTRVATATPSLTPPAQMPTKAPSYTATLEATPELTAEPSSTLVPTPVYGRVQSPTSDGVMVRVKPAGTSITTVENGYLAEILGDTPVVIDRATWVHVLITTPNRVIEGWVLSELIVTATPSFSP